MELDDVSITAVTLSTPQARFPLELEGDDWQNDFDFTSFAAMQTAVEGPFTVEVIGGPLASTSTFDFNASSLADGDFFAAPTIVNPTHGETGVASDVTLLWTDPSGMVTPDFLEAEVEGENDSGFQSDDSDNGLSITDTSWQPPVPLDNGPHDNGPHEFGVLYVNADSSPLGSAIQVTTGSIVWGDAPSAPPGYPAETPLLAIGSEAIIGFTVREPEVALLYAAALGTLGLLARSRR